ncbi:hypothetical protein EDB84DRAFT_1564035 [Lactarius hengduanensis]|nr:hypothetical protein EDB84DRAFT_1564035 [Lactarius hengduanensis]
MYRLQQGLSIKRLARQTPLPWTDAEDTPIGSTSDGQQPANRTVPTKSSQASTFPVLAQELAGFNVARESARLDKYLKDELHPFRTQDGWMETAVKIRLPVEGKSFVLEDDTPTLLIPHLFHRRIIDIIETVCASKTAESFRFTPYTMHWCPDPDNPDKYERVYADSYVSDAMVQAQVEVDNLPRLEGDTKEHVALCMMLASDSALLTNFGTATVWPIYIMFANQPKQERAKPTYHAVHHLAYVPSTGQPPSPEVETHCKRDLMHAMWNHLMDEAFTEGYTQGLVIRCTDGTERNFFPRIITYTADYPEKRNSSSYYQEYGTITLPPLLRQRLRIDNEQRRQKVEAARKLIYQKGFAITSKRIQDIMGNHSMVPTRNAFSEILTGVGHDYHKLFVVDLLHEFELGIWQSVLTHLIRMLYSLPGGDALIAELDSSTPTFGRDTIRKLPGSVSRLSKLAARDYEDILQSSIPAFEGLFPDEDNKTILDLIFLLSTWHAYAKLRLHTDSTLKMLETVGTSLCQALRQFTSTTSARYATRELPREKNARVARQQNQLKPREIKATKKATRKATDTVKHKPFNMSTYKMHCIPDYPQAIRQYGTTDSYSTQTSELTHRLSKMWYRMSNKNHRYIQQIADRESRNRFYTAMCEELSKGQVPSASVSGNELEDAGPPPIAHPPLQHEEASPTDPGERYWMPKTDASTWDLGDWLYQRRGDPALREFRTRLHDHLRARIQGVPYSGDEHDFTAKDRDEIIIERNRLHVHKTIRFKSTTYDAQRMEETANPQSRADIIVLAHEDDKEGQPAFPYWHARVVGIYHFMVRERTGRSESSSGLTDARRMDVLHVRWLGLDTVNGRSGWRAQRLHRVGFLPDTDVLGPAFGFLDPSEAEPDFYCQGLLWPFKALSSTSVTAMHPDGEFSDRDLFMRYRGGGVGHLGTRQCDHILLADEHMPLGEIQGANDNPVETAEYQVASDSDLDSEDRDEDEDVSDRGEDYEPELVLANSNDVDIVTAAGFAAL